MKNKHFTIVALAAAALATSCASEDIAEPQKQKQNQGGPKTVKLTASVNEAQTRVGMTKDGTTAKFYWHNGDKILVQTKNGDTYSGVEFTTTANTGDKTAKFTGEIAEGKVAGYAVYPYSESHKFTSETVLTYNLPAGYTYDKVESGIFSKTEGETTTYRSTSTNMPMLGTISDNSISFKHLGGLAVIRIDEMPATDGTLTITANEQLSGEFSVDLSADADEAKIETATASDNNTVTFNFSNVTKGATGVFYLPLATGEYTNVKVTIGETAVDCGSVSISRAGVTAVSIATYAGTLSEYSGKLLRSYGSNKYLINDREFVDLGLSVLWATMNVGATSVEGYGDYYEFGKAGSAATSWASSCRLPSKDECQELIDNCNWNWTAENNVNGYKVTGKKDGYTGNSIFLPAAGYKYVYAGDGWTSATTTNYDIGSKGYYLSSTSTSIKAYTLDFTNGTYNVTLHLYTEEDCPPVRPVATLN